MNEADQAFGAGHDPGSTPPQPPSPPEVRRLYREPEDKRIAGVCAGLADHFAIDPTIVRLAVILLTLTTGVAPVAYAVAAFVVPERPPTVPRRTAAPGATDVWGTGTKVLVAVLAIAFLAFADVGWWFNMPTIAIALVGVGVWLLVVERDRQGEQPPGGAPLGSATGSEKTTPMANAWSAGATTLVDDPAPEGDDTSGLGEATSVDATGAVGDTASDDDPATRYVGAASDHGAQRAGPQGEVPPPVPPWGVGSPAYGPAQPPHSPHPARAGRGAGLPLGVIAALFLGAGAVSLLAVLDVGDLSPHDVVAGAVLLIGAAMVLGAWWGNARPLIALGLPAVGVLLLADSVEIPLDAGAGDRTRVVDSVGELDGTYELTAGELTIDLRDLPLGPRTRSAPPTVEAEVGFGELVVIVPRDANVEVDAKAFVGNIVGGPHGEDDGLDVHERFELDGDEGGGRLVLDLEVGFGEIEVRSA